MSVFDRYLDGLAATRVAPPHKPILSLDFETYSEVDLRDAGASRYARDPSTEVLMLAYGWAEAEIKQWVPAEGESMPDDLCEALHDPFVTLAAWNAPFEMAITEHVLGFHTPVYRWLDVMALAFSLALPGKLETCGKVIGLPEDKKKDARGKALIRRFCQPRKPTKNMPWTRDTAETRPEEWEEFLEYNRQDVEAERQIYSRLKRYQMPDHEWRLWHLDQKINNAGIPVNIDAVHNAIRIAEDTMSKDMEEMRELTGLRNPNSNQQLLPWLREAGYQFLDLKKGHVERALKDEKQLVAEGTSEILGHHPDLVRVLELRLRVSKASVKKFWALAKATDDDGALRGCHQFAGAGRTWRWCLPAYTPVLVKRPGAGVCRVRITDVRLSDLVWDGCEWVHHEGVAYSGLRETVSFDGVIATPEHRVYINSWLQVPLAVAKKLEMEVWRGHEPVSDLPADLIERAQLHWDDQDGSRGALANALHESSDDRQATSASGFHPQARAGGFRDGSPGERLVERAGKSLRGQVDQGPVARDEHLAWRRGWGVRDCLFLASDSGRSCGAGGVYGETFGDPKAADGRKPGVARGDCGGSPGLARGEPSRSISAGFQRASGRHARELCSSRALGSARPPVREIRRAAFHRLCEGSESARELPQASFPSISVGREGSVAPEVGNIVRHERSLGRDVERGPAEGPGEYSESPSRSEEEVRGGPGALGSREGASSGGAAPVLGGEAGGKGEPTFDIINAGPRNRFTAWGRVVSNSGRRFQPQNLSKPSKDFEKWLLDQAPKYDLDTGEKLGGLDKAKAAFGVLVEDVEKLPVAEFQEKYPDTMEALVAAVRPMVQAGPGELLADADLSAIENVVLGWLARDDKILRVFRQGLDPYIDFATDMFGMSYDAIAAEVEAGDKSKRTTAKPGVLGCGYMLGKGEPKENKQTGEIEATGLLGYAWGMGVMLTPEMSALSVETFRSKFKRVKAFWYEMEDAVKRVIRTGRPERVGYLRIDMKGPFMRIGLPSGRHLHYMRPKLVKRTMPWGKVKTQVTYQNMENGQWRRTSTHPGKLVENCFAADTPVVTDRGPVPISQVRPGDRIWDGQEFVRHGGVIARGVRRTQDFGGVRVTPEHRIWIEGEWHEAGSREHHEAASSYARHFGGAGPRPDSDLMGGDRRQELLVEHPMRLRHGVSDAGVRVSEGEAEVLRVPTRDADFAVSPDARNDGPPHILGVEVDGGQVRPPQPPGLGQLRRAGYRGLRTMGRLVRGILGGHGADLRARADLGSDRQRRTLRRVELPLDHLEGAGSEQETEPTYRDAVGRYDGFGGVGEVRHREDDAYLSAERRGHGPRPVRAPGHEEQVYDILNCGPRRRFVVDAPEGRFLAHNCVQAVARDLLAHGMMLADGAGFDIRLHVHDQLVATTPEDRAEEAKDLLVRLMTRLPDWADDKLPLKAAGHTTPIFVKD